MLLSLDLMVLGIVTLVYIFFLSAIGIKIGLIYFKNKKRVYLYTGLSIMGTAVPWSGAAIFFISEVFFDIIPPMEIFFLFHGAFIPLFSVLWILAMLDVFEVYPKKRTWIKIIMIIFWTSLNIIYLIFIFTDTTLLGTLTENNVIVDYAPFNQLYLSIALIQVVITLTLLGVYSWKSDDPKIHLRGKLIIISVCIFASSVILEILMPIIPMLILARFLVMFYAVFYYMGFIMPKWVENMFLGEDKT
ncbi:MAG: hypothetical protein ACFFDK_16430 [Promethearchaeota archaeon]